MEFYNDDINIATIIVTPLATRCRPVLAYPRLSGCTMSVSVIKILLTFNNSLKFIFFSVLKDKIG